jgi:hypothetical protein
MELIEKVGSYVGLLAFLGFAALAFLFFSQARDVRRLRDWAGRAPERMMAAAQRLEAEQPEAQRVETAGEEAQAAHEGAPEEPVEEPGTQPPPTPAPLPGPPGAPQRAGPPTSQPPAYETYESSSSPLERVLPGAGTPGTGYPRRDRYSPRRRGIASRLPQPRYLAVVGGGILLLVVGIIGATNLLGGDDGEGTRGGGQGAVAVPADVTVSVLNGTSVPGAAAQIGDQVQQSGYTLGPVTNSSSSFDQSVIMFKPGREKEAQQVSKDVGIGAVRAMTPEISGLAGAATVAIVVGQDRASE